MEDEAVEDFVRERVFLFQEHANEDVGGARALCADGRLFRGDFGEAEERGGGM